MWTADAVSSLLQGLQSRRSLWDSKCKDYSNADKKKREYEKLLTIIHESSPDITLVQMKGKIQSIPTQYREELRKKKKSQSTGSGTSEIYRPKWQFFEECEFLQGVVGLSSVPCKTNVVEVEEVEDDEATEVDDSDRNTGDEPPTANATKRKMVPEYTTSGRKNSRKSWMEKAATGIENISQQDDPDEWDVFGKDVANDIRSLPAQKRRRAQFGIQKLFFEIHEEQGQWSGVQPTTAAERPSSAPAQMHIHDASASYFQPIVQSDQVLRGSALTPVDNSYGRSQ